MVRIYFAFVILTGTEKGVILKSTSVIDKDKKPETFFQA